MNIIPLIKSQDQRFSIVLNNQNCTIRVYQRKEFIYLDLYVGETEIILGCRCATGVFLLRSSHGFIGNLIFINTNDVDPTIESFGDASNLVYLTLEEVVNGIS